MANVIGIYNMSNNEMVKGKIKVSDGQTHRQDKNKMPLIFDIWGHNWEHKKLTVYLISLITMYARFRLNLILRI